MLLKGLHRSQMSRLQQTTTAVNALAKTVAPKRGYFSFVDKMRDKFYKPWRHVQSFIEPDGINY